MKKFKVLIYNGQYVDVKLLYKGLYPTYIPTLWKNCDTIETIKNKYRTDNMQYSIFENLSRCKLIEYSLDEVSVCQ